MRILNIRPASPPGGTGVIAVFDVDLSEEIRLFDVVLKRTRAGDLRSWPAKLAGRPSAAIRQDLADRITRAAVAAIEAGRPHAHNRPD